MSWWWTKIFHLCQSKEIVAAHAHRLSFSLSLASGNCSFHSIEKGFLLFYLCDLTLSRQSIDVIIFHDVCVSFEQIVGGLSEFVFIFD